MTNGVPTGKEAKVTFEVYMPAGMPNHKVLGRGHYYLPCAYSLSCLHLSVLSQGLCSLCLSLSEQLSRLLEGSRGS